MSKGSIADKIKINSYASLFGETDDAVTEISIDELHDFPEHPFMVKDDDDMEALVRSISENGIITPIIVRVSEAGGYEIIAGHRRRHAAERIGLGKIPAIIRKMTDDEAVVFMVDTNLQRERILPSEKAFSYKMKMEAIKHQGQRITSEQIVPKYPEGKSSAIIGEQTGESYKQVERFIKLTELISELLAWVDEEKIPVNAGVILANLDEKKQRLLFELIADVKTKISISEARDIRALADTGNWSRAKLSDLLYGKKQISEKRDFHMSEKELREYFPENVTEETIRTTIRKLLADWKKKTE